MKNNFIAGKYVNQKGYKSFRPFFINHDFGWEDKEIDLALEKATKNLGELNTYSRLIPDVNFYIKMSVAKEATTSSRIEGTKTNLDEAILPREEVSPEKRDDWAEVQNYITAMETATSELKKLPISMRLIKIIHKELLSGVRGKDKMPGEVRSSQNWIGGSKPSDAFFVPPHPDELPALLSDLERFWHNDELLIPDLIKIAIFHYQFETIHPFCDGNGRMGRLLIVLELIERNYLDRPTLYISDFFDKHRNSYYDSLSMVRQNNDLEQWIKFFLNGVIDTSEEAKITFDKIVQLRRRYEEKIATLGTRAKRAESLMLAFFSSPIMSLNQVVKALGVPYPSANRLMADFEKLGIVRETTGFSRNRLFAMEEYLNLFKS